MCIEYLLCPVLSALYLISQLICEVAAIIILMYNSEETEAQRV